LFFSVSEGGIGEMSREDYFLYFSSQMHDDPDFRLLIDGLDAPDDPGAIIILSSDQEIHTCLGLAHSPVAQGADERASAGAFRNWISLQFKLAYDHSQVERDQLLFHHMTDAEFLDVQNRYMPLIHISFKFRS
jgi:hypothetical protein